MTEDREQYTMGAAWQRFAASPEAIFAAAWCEAIAWKGGSA